MAGRRASSVEMRTPAILSAGVHVVALGLAVVAPGISEALFATAIGLVAAIPAAGAYNILSGQVQRYAAQLEEQG